MKKIRIIFVVIIILLIIFVLAFKFGYNEQEDQSADRQFIDPYNISYFIAGEEVDLKNGEAEQTIITGSASSIKTKIFEAGTEGDVNGDGLADMVVVLIQEQGGSSTFYYIAVAIQTPEGYQGTNAVLLGDRITPQTTSIENQVVIVNYAERAPGESYDINPSIGVSKYLIVFNNDLREISYNDDLIQVYSPGPGDYIESPLTIFGQARGNWFFEATFPLVLVDWDGLIIAEGYATAQGDWMTIDYVPFTAELEFVRPIVKDNGVLILRKDNPSGLPANDDALEVSVFFK